MSDVPEVPPTVRPKFLDPVAAAMDSYEHDKPPDHATEDEREADPVLNKPLRPRHREVARLNAIGKTNIEIAEKLNYTPGRVWQILQLAPVKQEVQRYRDRLFDMDVMTRLKDLGGDAVNSVEELLRDPTVSATKKIQTAQWLIEKLTGKAKQEHSVESNTLAAFIETLRQMQQGGEQLDVIDVTTQQDSDPAEPRPVKQLPAPGAESKFSKWVDEEL